MKDMSVRTMEDQPALHELIKMQQHVNVLERSINRLSSKAEIYGAVHQELRMNHAMNLMLKHVENLKEHFEKDRSDLEIARKALIDNNLNDVLSHERDCSEFSFIFGFEYTPMYDMIRQICS
ncbi:hypothetical protein HELRODRAFT_158330 [Helobdella robusta]|uniref:Uncharacterized protein n=1 Tax=Helobdella robusta TaxID=6412 RepID=T1EMN9_HELRO|nr:hypothetical protein HELRODRAFT_158330 [Helobdella robusta]ESO11965.1 hypothetical protein HELRODRAFT_158330 [Helobdella robusta]